MGKNEKKADAIVKEDIEVMATQDEGVIPNESEKNDEVITEKETEVITEQNIDDTEDQAPESGEGVKPDDVEIQDEKINKVGTDVETLKRPESEPVEDVFERGNDMSEFSELRRIERQNIKLRGAIVYLVKSLMTPADIEDFKILFPGLM